VTSYVAHPSKDISKFQSCADTAKLTTSAGNVYVEPSANNTAHKLTDIASISLHLPFTGLEGVTTEPVLSVK